MNFDGVLENPCRVAKKMDGIKEARPREDNEAEFKALQSETVKLGRMEGAVCSARNKRSQKAKHACP